jgi:hypothetical protein
MRTPLAVGVIWALTFWVLSLSLPPAFWSASLLRSVGSQVSRTPFELDLSIAILVVYIVGVVLEALGKLILGIFRFGLGVTLVASILAIVAITVRFLWYLPLTAMFLVAGYAFLLHRRGDGRPYKQVLHDILLEAWARIATPFHSYALEIARSFVPDYRMFKELAKFELEEYFAKNPDFLKNAVNDLDDLMLKRALEMVGVTLADVAGHVAEASRTTVFAAPSIVDLWSATIANEAFRDAMKAALYSVLERSAAVRQVFAESCLDTEGLNDALRGSIREAETRFRVDQSDLFADFDRLKAEGEFRSGVAVPVAALVGACAYTWQRHLDGGHGRVIFWALVASAVIGVVLDQRGALKTRKARQLLYSCIRQELVKILRTKRFGKPILVKRLLPFGVDASNYNALLEGVALSSSDQSSDRSPFAKRIAWRKYLGDVIRWAESRVDPLPWTPPASQGDGTTVPTQPSPTRRGDESKL